MKNKKNVLVALFMAVQFYLSATPIIDVVIPCHEKDARTLDLAIEGIKKNGVGVRRVIIISAKQLTTKAEWFDEAQFPFSKKEIALAIFHDDKKMARDYRANPNNRLGWIYQQLLKLYAPLVISNISSNVLVVDADTIFLNKVNFIDDQGNALFNVGSQYYLPYFEHMARVLPGLKRVFNEYSGICHHMLLQRYIIEDFFKEIRNCHNDEPWHVMCKMIDKNELFRSALAEYEMYFNYVFSHNYKARLRFLSWREFGFSKQTITAYRNQGCHYVSCHTYMH